MDYHSAQETAENGIVYHRIFDESFSIRGEAYNPVKLRYGYRWIDKKMFVFDFEKQKETFAFDFNLSKGVQPKRIAALEKVRYSCCLSSSTGSTARRNNKLNDNPNYMVLFFKQY